MKQILAGAALAVLAPAMVTAQVGLDRSGQPLDIVFADDNLLELSFGRVMPSVDGTDVAIFGGRDSGNVGDDYSQVAGALNYRFSDALSMALIVDEPYGSDLNYPATTSTANSAALGGTRAIVDSSAITALARYRINDRVSVHGGLRYQQISADVTLSGAAYGGLSGYNGRFDEDGAFGYVVGAAYEIPEIALRVALTYSSEIDHDLDTRETLGGVPVSAFGFPASSSTEVTTPESFQLDVQSGIAPGTLLFGSVRFARYSATLVSPTFFDAALPDIDDASLTDIDSNYALEVGIGRRFSDRLSGSATVGYVPEKDDLVSPLAPRNGQYSLALGVAYDVTDAFTLSGGVNYTWLGDAQPETGTPDVARATFEDNSAIGLGVKVGYRF